MIMEENIAVNLVTEIFKQCLISLKGTAHWAKHKTKEYDIFNNIARQYVSRIYERYNYIKVLGMGKPVPLTDIFVQVNILGEITSSKRMSIEQLERMWFFNNNRGKDVISTINGLEIAKKFKKTILLGKPGAGKTTLLKYITLYTLSGNTYEDIIPIFISLKDLADSKKDLYESIIEEFELCNLEDAEPFIQRMLDRGNFLIMLDGLDEVEKAKQRDIIQMIKKFVDKFYLNKFIISCRVAAYDNWFSKFRLVEVADFTDKQIEQFIINWFSSEPQGQKKCLAEFNENKRMREVAQIPLLLTLLCLAFEQTHEFPNNRAELYREGIDALLKKWDSSRWIKRENVYKKLSLKLKESMFSQIAFESFTNDQYFLPQRLLEIYIKRFIENIPGFEEDTIYLDSEAIIKSVESQHGIFVERAKYIYSFSHLTFQEYFTAKYIVDYSGEDKIEVLLNNLIDSKWREVILLTANLLFKADDYLSKIKDKLLLFYEDDKLLLFFRSIYNQLRSNTDYPPPLLVLAGLCCVVNYSSHKDYSSKTFPLAKSLSKYYMNNYTLNLSMIDRYESLSLAEHFKLIKRDNFLNYLYVHQLLLDCLLSESYVSKDLRASIIEDMYRPIVV